MGQTGGLIGGRRGLHRLLCMVVLGASLAVSSCVKSARYDPLRAMDRPSRTLEQVELYLTTKPSRAYVEMGVLTYRAGTAEHEPAIYAALRRKAAEIGADGIIVTGNSTGPSMVVGGMVATLRDFTAVAIAYEP